MNFDVDDAGARWTGSYGWKLGLAVGPIFQSRKRNAYFYDVSSDYVRTDRPAYRSAGGYAGSQFIAVLSRRFDRYWVGGFVRADTLRGATFDDSPLVRRRSAFAAGLGVTYVFGKSTQTVDVVDR